MPYGELQQDFFRQIVTITKDIPLFEVFRSTLGTVGVERMFYCYIPPFGVDDRRDPPTIMTWGFEPQPLESYLESRAFLHDDELQRSVERAVPHPVDVQNLNGRSWARNGIARSAYEHVANLVATCPCYDVGCAAPRGAGTAYTFMVFPAGSREQSLTELMWLQVICQTLHNRYCCVREISNRFERTFPLTREERQTLALRALGKTAAEVEKETGFSRGKQDRQILSASLKLLAQNSSVITTAAKAIATGQLTRFDYAMKTVSVATPGGINRAELRAVEKLPETPEDGKRSYRGTTKPQ